jgi:cytochrome P450
MIEYVSVSVSRLRQFCGLGINNVLLVKIEGPVWYTIYHHLPMGKGHLCLGYVLVRFKMQ